MEGETKNEMPRSIKVFDAKSEVSRIGMVPCVSRGKVENVEGDYTEQVQYLSLSVYISLSISLNTGLVSIAEPAVSQLNIKKSKIVPKAVTEIVTTAHPKQWS